MNQIDYGMRVYDPRVGKFLSVDPLTKDYPELTPYQYASNSPIAMIDVDGLEGNLYFYAKMKYTKTQQVPALRNYPQPNIPYHPQPIRYFLPNTSANKSWTQNWRDSKNLLANILYDAANGLYTLPQQLTASIRNEDYVYNIGGNAHNAHGIWGEKQRLNNFVNGATVLVPGAPAAAKIEAGIVKYADNIITKIETEATEQVSKEAPVIIGEGMKRVSVEAAKHPGSTILENMPKFTGTAEQITNQMMAYNRKWLLQMLKSGRPILDIGLDATRAKPSIFYQMEQNMLKNYLKRHPNAIQIINP